jgi:hypothetical protein
VRRPCTRPRAPRDLAPPLPCPARTGCAGRRRVISFRPAFSPPRRTPRSARHAALLPEEAMKARTPRCSQSAPLALAASPRARPLHPAGDGGGGGKVAPRPGEPGKAGRLEPVPPAPSIASQPLQVPAPASRAGGGGAAHRQGLRRRAPHHHLLQAGDEPGHRRGREGAAPGGLPSSPGWRCEWKWLGSASVELCAQGAGPLRHAFKVTVQPGLVALDGAPARAALHFEFQTPARRCEDASPPATATSG